MRINKLLSCFLIGLSAISSSIAAQEKPLFVGKKFFSFYGGSGSGQSITIKANGNTIVEGCGASGCVIEYKGKFTNPLRFKDGGGLLFKDGKVYALHEKGGIEKDCMGDDEPCMSELY